MKTQYKLWILAVVFAIFMSLPWLVPGLGFLALIGFVPLLCMDKIASDNGTKHFFWYYFAAFTVWNLITTWWVCNATVGGGIFASVANALQMAVVFALFRFSKKRLTGALPYIFLAVAWIAWERFYFSAQISWPWLVLGHAFARTITLAQWYSTTGVLGGSLWIWATNLAIFGMMCVLGDGRFFGKFNAKARFASIVGTVLVFFGPMVASLVIWNSYEEEERPFEVLVTQPDIDPYYKYGYLTQAQQDEILVHLVDSTLAGVYDSLSFGLPRHDGVGAVSSTSALTKRNSGSDDGYIDLSDSLAAASDSLDCGSYEPRPLLILAPETFNGGLVCNNLQMNKSWDTYTRLLSKYPDSNLIFGASTYEYIPSALAPSYTARLCGESLWRESHNSAILVDAMGRGQIFHKTKLVVGTESMPFPKFFSKIDNALGGVIGRCVGQKEISCLTYHSDDGSLNVPFGCAVCYESVYGEYCTGYVRKGAEALAVITNDAWWGDTAGYKQHCSYSSLRAIETRRSIARSANSGISCIIDQKGRIVEKRGWWDRSTIHGTINLNDRITPFVKYGDIVGRVATLLFLLILGALMVRTLLRSGRGRYTDSSRRRSAKSSRR